MNIQTNSWQISRRHVLRGLGATIALPLLDCMRPALAAAAGAAREAKRSVFLYIPNGVNTLTWQIQKAGTDFELPACMAALEKHRANLTPISGLHHPMVIGKHHNCDKVWLTGANVPADGGPFRNSVSADQLIAEVQGAATRFPSLELAITGHSLGWSREGIQLPAERNSQAIFNRLFGVERDSREIVQKRLERRGSILDLVIDDAKEMSRKVGSSDRTKLDEYLTAVRELEVRTERAKSWLDVPKPKIDPSLSQQLQRKVDMKQAGEYYRLFYDLMALALQTDSTRVITCMIGSESHGLAIPEIGVVQTRHELSHHNGDPEQLRRLTETDTFLIEQLAYFLDKLASLEESGRPLLDTTQVLWGSGMSYGHSHGNANLPLLLAGGRALGLKHGKHVDFNLPKIGSYNVADAGGHYKICGRPVDESARVSNLLLTLCQTAGVEIDRFHDSVRTLSEIV
jgi:hypothetical protein